MRRRELLAGVGSVGVLGAAGAISLRGLPPIGDTGSGEDPSIGDDADSDGESTRDPIRLETIDAPGSEAGEIALPADGQPTFIDFFATWCAPCEAQMPALAEANERIGDEVFFVSVTTEGLPEAEIVEWWEEHDGNWPLARDPTTELAARYNPPGYPHAVAIDAAGTVQWSSSGRKTADEFVDGIERAI